MRNKLKQINQSFTEILFKKTSKDILDNTDMLALIRVASLGMIMFSIANLIVIFLGLQAYPLIESLGILTLALISVFVATFFPHKHTLWLLYAHGILAVCVFTLMTKWVGVTIGYHLGILVVILLFFFKTGIKRSAAIDIFWALFLTQYSYFVWYFVSKEGAKLPLSYQDIFIFSFIYISLAGFYVFHVAWFYHMKFAKNEDELLAYNSQLEELSKTDTLTKLKNRRGILDYLDEKTKHGDELYFVMCDIDFFKKINDSYGHDVGDVVLQKVASILQTEVSNYGLVGRWGGEEFLITLQNRTQNQVVDLMEKIRQTIARETFWVTPEKNFFVTITMGIASHTKDTFEESIKEADSNLYIGKAKGRNRVIY